MKTIKRLVLPLLLLMTSTVCVAQDFDALQEQFIQYYDTGQYEKAIEVLQQLLEIQKETIGEESLDYASSLNCLGRCYYRLGNYSKAIELYTQALEIQKETIGEDSLDYASSLNRLGLCYYCLGDYTKAIELYTQALEIQKETIGEESLDYASSLNRLGLCYYRLGDYAKAIEIIMQALEIQKKVLGEEHSDVAAWLNVLALCYSELGDHTKVIELRTLALEITKKTLGEEHPDYLKSLKKLANYYSGLGDYAKAIDIRTQALEIDRKIHGEEHEDVLLSLRILSSYYYGLGDFSKAVELYSQATGRDRKSVGEEVSWFLNNLPSLPYKKRPYDLRDYVNAIELYSQLMEIQMITLGEEHPDVASSLNTLGDCYAALGEYAEAIDLYSRAQDIWKKTLGEKSSDYAILLNNLGNCYFGLGNYVKAVELHSNALIILKKIVGGDHPNYAKSLSTLFDYYYSLGDFSKVIELFSQVLEIDGEKLVAAVDWGQKHLEINPYDCGIFQLGEYSKAIELYRQEESKNDRIHHGRMLSGVIYSLNYLGHSYFDLEDYSKAIELFSQALDIIEKTLDEESPDYAKSLSALGVCYSCLGGNHQAIKLEKHAMDIYKKFYGKYNSYIVQSLHRLASYYYDSGYYRRAIKLYKQEVEIRRHDYPDDYFDFDKEYLGLALFQLAGCYWGIFDYAKAVKLDKEAINISYDYLLHLFRYGITKKRVSEWEYYSWNFLSWYPYMFFEFGSGDTSSLGDLYDKSCLFAKGLLLATEMEMRKMVQESGNEEAMETFNQMQVHRNMIAKQIELPIAERTLNIDSLERETEWLEMKVMRLAREYGDFMANLKLKWQDVQRNLGADDVAVEFLSFPLLGDTTQYIALTLRKGYESPHLVPLFTSVELDEAKDNAYTDHGLSRLVWGRMSTELEGVKNIYFSPSGELHNIGIESMPHWSDDCLMSDRFDLYRLSSTRELALSRNVVPSQGAIVYGGIEFGTSVPTMVSKSGKVGDEAHSMSDIYARHVQKARLARNLQESRDWKINDLPGTMTEAESVHKQLKSKLKKQDVVLLTGSDATEESFKRLSGHRDRVIHIATHGMYLKADQASGNRRKQQLSFLFHDSAGQGFTEDESLSRSCLLFSGARNTFNNLKIPDDIDDGVLTANEVAHLDLRGLDLVVLSACETGLGDVTGDGVMGLQRGFKKAGAQSIVMSLWTVDDAATRDMMEQFYKQLKPDLSNKREAFLNAQQDVRKNDDQYKYSDNPEIDARLRKTRPHWAAFILLDALK